MDTNVVTLAIAEPCYLPAFKRELQHAFGLAVIEAFGPLPNGPIPCDADLDASFAAPGAEVLLISCDGGKVGGAVMAIDDDTHHNTLVLFFISAGNHGRGLGRNAWRAIEKRYPQTRVWRTNTPYFEKRNIHFYVNKCGFKIVEFFNAHHADPSMHGPDDLPGGGDSFLFEKDMRGLDGR